MGVMILFFQSGDLIWVEHLDRLIDITNTPPGHRLVDVLLEAQEQFSSVSRPDSAA